MTASHPCHRPGPSAHRAPLPGAWEPAGAVTGMAVEFVAENSPEIPFWPQLLSRDVAEGMMIQSLPVGRPARRRVENVGLQVDAADLDNFEQVLAPATDTREGSVTPRDAPERDSEPG
ncbi:MAG: hypothetical protein ACRDV9_07975 [Acidimicrobiia bacterium]